MKPVHITGRKKTCTSTCYSSHKFTVRYITARCTARTCPVLNYAANYAKLPKKKL